MSDPAACPGHQQKQLITGQQVPARNLRVAMENSAWMVADKLLRSTLSLLVGAWIARYLGPNLYGELAYVLSLLALYQAACALGLDGIVVRDIAQREQNTGAALGNALRMRLAAGVIGWLSSMMTVALLRPGDINAVMMMAISGAALIFQPAEVVDLWLQSQSRSRVSVPYRLLAYCVGAATKIALIVELAPLWAFAVTTLVDAAAVSVGLYVAYRRFPSQVRWSWNRLQAAAMLHESWPFLLSAVSICVYMRIDQVMLREISGAHELGIYSAVMPFSQAWQMVPMTLCVSALPRLSQLKITNEARYVQQLQRLFTVMAWSGLAAAAITAALAPYLTSRLLGSGYSGAASVLQWHAITNIFVFLGVAQGVVLLTERTPRISLVKALAGALVSVSLNLMLLPRWGALGAAWSAIASYFMSAILLNAVLAPHTFLMQMRSFLPRNVLNH